MQITRKEVYAFAGVHYETFNKAKEAAEERVAKLVTSIVLESKLGHADAYRLTLKILEHRDELRVLLNYPDKETDCIEE